MPMRWQHPSAIGLWQFQSRKGAPGQGDRGYQTTLTQSSRGHQVLMLAIHGKRRPSLCPQPSGAQRPRRRSAREGTDGEEAIGQGHMPDPASIAGVRARATASSRLCSENSRPSAKSGEPPSLASSPRPCPSRRVPGASSCSSRAQVRPRLPDFKSPLGRLYKGRNKSPGPHRCPEHAVATQRAHMSRTVKPQSSLWFDPRRKCDPSDPHRLPRSAAVPQGQPRQDAR